MNNFHYAMTQAKMLYDVDMNPDDFEELGLIAWELIGNKRTRLYKYTGKVHNKMLELPCNADIIEAVTANYEDWNYTSNIETNGDLNTQYVENFIEGAKLDTNPLYISGKFINYYRLGDSLFFDSDYSEVNVLYKGIVVDEDGLPELTDKESLAIATYLAYVKKFKEGIVTNNANIIQLANLLQLKWNIACDAARVTYLNLNDMNDILDAKTSWARKTYNKSYKPIK